MLIEGANGVSSQLIIGHKISSLLRNEKLTVKWDSINYTEYDR